MSLQLLDFYLTVNYCKQLSVYTKFLNNHGTGTFHYSYFSCRKSMGTRLDYVNVTPNRGAYIKLNPSWRVFGVRAR